MDVPDVWPTVTATDPLQIHLAPLAARLDYLERSLALGMYNVYSAIESLSTVVSYRFLVSFLLLCGGLSLSAVVSYRLLIEH